MSERNDVRRAADVKEAQVNTVSRASGHDCRTGIALSRTPVGLAIELGQRPPTARAAVAFCGMAQVGRAGLAGGRRAIQSGSTVAFFADAHIRTALARASPRGEHHTLSEETRICDT